jgi:hypothetical protein
VPSEDGRLTPETCRGFKTQQSGFGGLEVSVVVFGTQVRRFEPGRNRRIFQGEKILSTPSFGGEVKSSVYVADLRHVKDSYSGVEVAIVGIITRCF